MLDGKELNIVLKKLFCHKCKKPKFIPENIFYRLATKANNETAERFQAFVADEIIPSIRKHGAYMTPQKIEAAVVANVIRKHAENRSHIERWERVRVYFRKRDKTRYKPTFVFGSAEN